MMTRCFSPLARRLVSKTAVPLAIACVALGIPLKPAAGYVLSGQKWASDTQLVFQLNLGSPLLPLSDGNTSWNAAVAPALDLWNEKMQRLQVSGVVNSGAPLSSGDRVNTVAFSNTVLGHSFGSNTLAMAVTSWQGSTLIEADIVFNRAMTFDSYRGPLKFPPGGGLAIADIRRVFLHEVGHGIGLKHPDTAGQNVDAVMNAMVSNREVPSNDDIAGLQAMYGAPASSTPTPTPTPAPPPPSPTPTPTPATGVSHLANISTRMKVGTGENVLIGGFIIKGAESKRLILRATGPSLAAAGVAGVLRDPVLELYDAAGKHIAENDDWQSGTQAAEIIATGVAPTVAEESALVVTLPAGSYTAVVSGWDNTQGVALIEAYELDTTASRLVNLSTRGRIGTGEEALIGGLIITGSSAKKVIVRAIGPSLGTIAGVLADPVLEVRDGSGNLVGENDNWGSSAQVADILASTIPPGNPLESAVVATLSAGGYTAIVRGVNNTSGVGLVEVFDLEP